MTGLGRYKNRGRDTYINSPPSSIQTKAISQPCVVSPRTDAQPRTRSRLNPVPATRAVKSIKTIAAI